MNRNSDAPKCRCDHLGLHDATKHAFNGVSDFELLHHCAEPVPS